MTKPLILIIDDELDMAEFVGEIAESRGFDVLISTSAIKFQQMYKSKQPSVIVMDIVMPDMDGIELIGWLADNSSTTPIILMSGYNPFYLEMTEKLGKRKSCNIVGTLIKPFTSEELDVLLQQIVNH